MPNAKTINLNILNLVELFSIIISAKACYYKVYNSLQVK